MDFIGEKNERKRIAEEALNELIKKNKLDSNSNIQGLLEIPKEKESILNQEVSSLSTDVITPSPNIKEQTIPQMDKQLRERRKQIEDKVNNLNDDRPEPLDLPQFQPILKEFTDNQPNNDGKIIRPVALRRYENDIIRETCNESDTINTDSDESSVGEQGDIDEIIDTGFWDAVVKHSLDNPDFRLNTLISVIYDYEDVYNRNFDTDLEPKLYEYIHGFYEKIGERIQNTDIKKQIITLKESMEKKHKDRKKIIGDYLGDNDKQGEQAVREDNNTCSPGSVKRTIIIGSNSAFTKKGGKKKKKLNKTNKVKKSKKSKKVKMTRKRKPKKTIRRRKHRNHKK